MSSILNWNGAAVKARVEDAARLAIDETTFSCIALAMQKLSVSGNGVPSKPGEPPHRQTGFLIGSVGKGQVKAQPEGNRIVGYWGSRDVNYAFALEVGTAHMAARPYLRVTADVEYPKLKARIIARMAGNRGSAK